MKEFLIGADPEGFAVDQNLNPVSVIPFIHGTKKEPQRTKNGFIHQDNVAWEIGFKPARNKKEFIYRVSLALKDITEIIQKHGYRVSTSPFLKFGEDQLQDPRAKVFLCDPDWNAWTLRKNPDIEFDDILFRSAAGHIHIGMEMNNKEMITLVRLLDIFLSSPVFMMESVERRQFYGRAGSFRVKPYGLEYRTPSNWWIWSQHTISYVYDQVQKAVNYLENPKVSNLVEHDKVGMFVNNIVNQNNNHQFMGFKKFLKQEFEIGLDEFK